MFLKKKKVGVLSLNYRSFNYLQAIQFNSNALLKNRSNKYKIIDKSLSWQQFYCITLIQRESKLIKSNLLKHRIYMLAYTFSDAHIL